MPRDDVDPLFLVQSNLSVFNCCQTPHNGWEEDSNPQVELKTGLGSVGAGVGLGVGGGVGGSTLGGI